MSVGVASYTHTEQEFVDACLAAGGMGYVTGSHMKTELTMAIDAALTGRKHVSSMGPTRH